MKCIHLNSGDSVKMATNASLSNPEVVWTHFWTHTLVSVFLWHHNLTLPNLTDCLFFLDKNFDDALSEFFGIIWRVILRFLMNSNVDWLYGDIASRNQKLKPQIEKIELKRIFWPKFFLNNAYEISKFKSLLLRKNNFTTLMLPYSSHNSPYSNITFSQHRITSTTQSLSIHSEILGCIVPWRSKIALWKSKQRGCISLVKPRCKY